MVAKSLADGSLPTKDQRERWVQTIAESESEQGNMATFNLFIETVLAISG